MPEQPPNRGKGPDDERIPEPDELQPEPGRDPETPAEAGRERLLGALRRPSKSQIGVAVLLALLGYAAVTQVRSADADDSYAGYREQDLIDVLNAYSANSERAEREINRLEQARDRIRNDSDAREAAIAQKRKEVDSLAILAGTVPVTGPGLRVTVNNTSGDVDINSLLDTVQELRSAGAESMEFNDEVRVVAQSHFEESAGVISLDGVPLESPYVIDVIGEPHTLQGALTFPQGPIDTIQDEGGSVEFDEPDRVDIESVVEIEDAPGADAGDAG